MENKVDMADVCELAHLLTVRECKKRHIRVDKSHRIFKDEELHYTAEAQRIFDEIYDIITNTLNV